jgi:autotransporter-associated beta strand protein
LNLRQGWRRGEAHLPPHRRPRTRTNFLNDPNVVTVNGGTLDLNGFSNQIGGLAGSGGTVLNNGGAASVFNVGIDDTNTVNTEYSGIIQNGSSNLSLTKRGAGTQTLSGVNTYTGHTTVSGGTLAINGSIVSPVTGEGGSIGGTGAISNTVTVLAGGSIAPGAPVGAFTVTGAINSSGTAFMEIDRTNTPAISDRLVGLSSVTLGGSLVVTNIGEALQAGDAFQLFSGAPLNLAFSNITLPGLGSGLAWSNSLSLNGSIAVVVSTLNTTATNITAKVSGANLEVSWPDDHTGWQLQVQTNSVSVGLGSNWVPWTGSVGTNQVFVPIDPANGAVFLRLVYPPQ